MTLELEWIDITKLKLEFDCDGSLFKLVKQNGDVFSFGSTVSACIDKIYLEQVCEKLKKEKHDTSN